MAKDVLENRVRFYTNKNGEVVRIDGDFDFRLARNKEVMDKFIRGQTLVEVNNAIYEKKLEKIRGGLIMIEYDFTK